MSRAFRAVAVAILKGFVRDRASVFFAIVFPLMFLVLFGGIFNDSNVSRSELIEIGRVGMINDLPKDARAAFDQTFKVTHAEDRSAALAQQEHLAGIQVQTGTLEDVFLSLTGREYRA